MFVPTAFFLYPDPYRPFFAASFAFFDQFLAAEGYAPSGGEITAAGEGKEDEKYLFHNIALRV